MMRISCEIYPNVTTQNPYVELSERIESCTSQEECIHTLLQENRYQLVYPPRKSTNLTNQCFYHFIRIRLALAQRDSSWFQKEMKALLQLWLTNETYFAHSLNQLGSSRLMELISYFKRLKAIEFSIFFVEPQDHPKYFSDEIRRILLRSLRV